MLEEDGGFEYALKGGIAFQQVLLPKTVVLDSLKLGSNSRLAFYHKECKFQVLVPALGGHQAFTEKVAALLFHTVGEVKNKIMGSHFNDQLSSQDYQLVLKGARLPDESKLGELNLYGCGSYFHLTRAVNDEILIHIQNDDGAYFDARIRPSLLTVAERECSSLVCVRNRWT